MITSTNHLTLSIGEAFRASFNNPALGPVTLAKGNDGTAFVIEAQFRNRRDRQFRFGYLRFGSSEFIWCGRTIFPQMPLSVLCENGLTLDEVICRETVSNLTKYANATEAARRAA